ncbi:MAG: hypothetical protein AAGA84_10805 [Pseudomonadota bacterium]
MPTALEQASILLDQLRSKLAEATEDQNREHESSVHALARLVDALRSDPNQDLAEFPLSEVSDLLAQASAQPEIDSTKEVEDKKIFRHGPWLRRPIWLTQPDRPVFADREMTPLNQLPSSELFDFAKSLTAEQYEELSRDSELAALEARKGRIQKSIRELGDSTEESTQEQDHAKRKQELETQIKSIEDAIKVIHKTATLEKSAVPSEFEIYAHVPNFMPSVLLVHIAFDRKIAADIEGTLWDGVFAVYESIEKTDDSVEDRSSRFTVSSFDFKSLLIHKLNRDREFRLAGNELEYIYYFMHLVRGEEGAFRILTPEMVKMVNATKAPLQDGRVRRPVVLGADGNGALVYQLSILYNCYEFNAKLAVSTYGMMDMIEDIPVDGDLDSDVVQVRREW